MGKTNIIILTLLIVSCFHQVNYSSLTQEDVKDIICKKWRLIHSYYTTNDRYQYPDEIESNTLEFFRDNTYDYRVYMNRSNGIWEFSDDNSKFRLIRNSDRDVEFYWKVLKMEKDTFRFQITRKGIFENRIDTYVPAENK